MISRLEIVPPSRPAGPVIRLFVACVTIHIDASQSIICHDFCDICIINNEEIEIYKNFYIDWNSYAIRRINFFFVKT